MFPSCPDLPDILMWTLSYDHLSIRTKREAWRRLHNMALEDNCEVSPGLCADRFCLTQILCERHERQSGAILPSVDVYIGVPGDGSGPFPTTLFQIRTAMAQLQSFYDPATRQIDPDAVLGCNMTARRFARAFILGPHLRPRTGVTQ